MTIKQSVINTFNRVGIDYEDLLQLGNIKYTVRNRFSGEACQTSPLIAECIRWIYNTSNRYEAGDTSIKVADFDRVRYFVAEQDPNAYSVCVD